MSTFPPTLTANPSPAVGRIRSFFLPLSEVARLREAGGPLAEVDLSQIRQDAQIAVVEVDGRIVAYWVVFRAVHAEPLWVADDHRRSPAVLQHLLDQTEQAIIHTGDDVVFAVIEHANAQAVGGYAHRLGFERVPGELYFLIRQPAQSPEEY